MDVINASSWAREINSAVVTLPLVVLFIKEEETLTSEDTVTPDGALLTKVETFVTSVELVTVPLKEYSEI